MLDALLTSIAGVINKIASKIPAVSNVPWEKVTGAIVEAKASLALWMDAFPFIYDILLIAGLMVGFHVAKIAWYWIRLALKLLPGVG